MVQTSLATEFQT